MTPKEPGRAADLIDVSTKFGARVASRLAQERVIWLTTVGATGTPQPNPVWFLWQEDGFVLFTQPGTPKLRNIARNPRVSLNLNSGKGGDGVVVFTGTALALPGGPGAAEIAAFTAKYAADMARLPMTEAEFYADYSVAVHLRPDRLRGF